MLIDAAHPEETRVVVLSGTRLEEFDFESSTKKQVKGNIYLAKVTRVEPSLQAAFVDYGGNRHGFLAFSEIHPDYYRIPVGDRESGEDDPAVGEAAGVASDAPFDGDSPAVPDEPPTEIADALPEAPPAVDQTEPEDEPEPAAAVAAEEPAGEAGEVAIAAPIEAVISTDPFFASSSPEPKTGSEEVETFDDDEAEEADAAERQRAPRHYKIQEVVKRRQIMLVQVAKEERGNKGAALTTYLSLAGRYCVLMPNTGRGGGVSRKITSASDRRRLKEILEDLDIPEGMGVIVRTAGAERSKAEIKRDYEYLLRLWSEIRDLTLRSTAPALIYEEGNLIKRSIRDLYARDIDEVIVEGEEGYRTAKTFMRMLTPSHAKRVQPYRDPQIGLFHRYQVESQIDAVHSPVAQLRSGGYLVINQTEALVSIDVNSGRSTRERNIEETASRTNLEAADEIARQLRLRDLAGLIVIDFIDMEEHRHNAAVERRIKEALKNDRARIQVGRISAFGLLEMSRQRLRPSLTEASTLPCPHCGGTGFIRSTESTALYVLRSIEEEGAKARSAEICVYVPTTVALYMLNQKRESLAQIEARYGLRVMVGRDDTLVPPNFRLERLRAYGAGEAPPPRPIAAPPPIEVDDEDEEDEGAAATKIGASDPDDAKPDDREGDEERGPRRRRRRRRKPEDGREPRRPAAKAPSDRPARVPEAAAEAVADAPRPVSGEAADHEGDSERRRRRRGRRGGRWRSREAGAAETGNGEHLADEIASAEDSVIREIVPVGWPGEGELAAESFASPPEHPAVDVAAAEAEPFAPKVAASERVRETVGAGNGAPAEVEPDAAPHPKQPDPEGQNVSDRPTSPRRGWWNRLIQP